MPSFFIDRPIFAWVIALMLCLIGALAITRLGIASYPDIAPAQITVTATYPGADAATMESTVTQVIEQQLTGIDNLLYFSSASNANGTTTITLSFAPGANPDIAQVQVQNKVALAQPLLPVQVVQQGVVVAKASPDILMFIALTSNNPAIDAGRLNDILASQIQPEIGRITGIGNTNLLGAEYAARIWLDPDKLQGYGLSAAQVLTAVAGQNVQFAAGSIGADPAVKGQVFTANVTGDTLFSSLQQFRDIIVLTNNDGTVVRLGDVARVSFGPQTYGTSAVLNGKPAGGLGLFLLPGANALSVGQAVKAKMATLARDLPPGVTWTVPYDTTPFITASIAEVLKTLAIAIALVFLVMLIFLQSIRATIIATLVIPVALLGAFIGLAALHFSLNQLTLFGMVLAIGIVVDDAIVVIENVERIMSEEGLSPKEATRKAMSQISGAIVAITVVLAAVFVPSALQPGATGIVFAQFALTIAVSTGFSAFLALSFTPSLCATILKPARPGETTRFFVFVWFNKAFDWVGRTYLGHVGGAVRHAPRWMLVFLVIAVLAGFLYTRLPTSFVPDEDQGFMLALVNLPPGSTLQSTDGVMKEVRAKLLHSPIGKDIAGMFQAEGFSFVGSSENVGMVFIQLTNWSKRSQTAIQLIPQANQILHGVHDAQIFAVNLPTIRGLSQFGGVDMFLQARAGQSRAQLAQAEGILLAKAGASPTLSGIRPNSLPNAAQLEVSVDRQQALAMGLSLTQSYAAVQSQLSPTFINQFVYQGRVKRVYIQGDAAYRMGLDALQHTYTPSGISNAATGAASTAGAATTTSGDLTPVNPSPGNAAISPYNMVPLSSVVKAKWGVGPLALPRYNGYSAIEIVGSSAAGYSSGQAIKTLQSIVDKDLPAGFDISWTGQSYQEILAGNSALLLTMLSIVIVFLCLAALYESWSIPVAVLLVVPLGLLGMLAFCLLRNIPNDIYFSIGLVTVIGLAAKNAILIVEFAVSGQASGMTLNDAVLAAGKLRLRPILMTSMAFILGVFPLVVSGGAGAASRHEIGTGVIGGMLFATFLGLLLIPVFYVTVRRLLGDKLDEVSHTSRGGDGPGEGDTVA
ncbi:MAG TPA: efflux RND transporter permease subunit [Caulobacteraceae bacterium]|nr:efflux RND transporter permease subunit [Caulobacteraceae bacterium]